MTVAGGALKVRSFLGHTKCLNGKYDNSSSVCNGGRILNNIYLQILMSDTRCTRLYCQHSSSLPSEVSRPVQYTHTHQLDALKSKSTCCEGRRRDSVVCMQSGALCTKHSILFHRTETMNAANLRCALCSAGRRPRVHHPYLPMRSLNVCVSCKQKVCARFEGHSKQPVAMDESHSRSERRTESSERSNGDSAPRPQSRNNAASAANLSCIEIHPQVARLIVLVEKLLWQSSEDTELKVLRMRIRQDIRKGLYKSPTNLGVDDRLVIAAASVFPLINIALVNGRLSFPLDPVALPNASDLRERIEISYANLMGPAEAWNKTFPHVLWESLLTSHSMFTQLLSLFGLKVMPEKRASRRRGDGTLMLERKSVVSVLEAAIASIPSSLSSVIVSPDVSARSHNLVQALALSKKFEQMPTVEEGRNRCACCGNHADKERYPFRFVQCTDCPRELCSVCLEQVFGAGELVRGLSGKKYRCPLCRVSLTAVCGARDEYSLQRKRERRQLEFMRRQLKGVKEEQPPKAREHPRFPPLALSRSTSMSLQRFSNPLRPDGPAAGQQKGVCTELALPSRDEIGFAKLCEDINVASFSSPLSSSTFPRQKKNGDALLSSRSTTVCMTCRLPLGAPADYNGPMNFNWNVYDSNANERSGVDGLKICEEADCGIILHDHCIKAMKVVGVVNSTASKSIEKNERELESGDASMSVDVMHMGDETVPDSSLNSDGQDASSNDGVSDKQGGSAQGCVDGSKRKMMNGDAKANETGKASRAAKKWRCGRHVCASCGALDVVMKCRTCTTAYCGVHTPHRDEIHLFGRHWMACECCRVYLEAPKIAQEPDSQAKIVIGANALTLADAVERERTISLTMINEIANLHETVDSRNALDMRSGIVKVHALRTRRESREASKRSVAERISTKAAVESITGSKSSSLSASAVEVVSVGGTKNMYMKEKSIERTKIANGKSKVATMTKLCDEAATSNGIGSRGAKNTVMGRMGEPMRFKSIRPRPPTPSLNRPPTSSIRANGIRPKRALDGCGSNASIRRGKRIHR